MNEAQVLGDRIGYLEKGQLKKVGSPAFLRKFYHAAASLVFTFMDTD